MPPWIANTWTSTQWAQNYQYMLNVRMDNEIWQWSVDVMGIAPIDVVAMQDGIGVGHATLSDVGSWYQAVCAGIKAGRPATQCWSDLETFDTSGSNKPAPVSRCIQQLQAEQAYVDRFTTYAYEQLDTPLMGDTIQYNDWLAYVNTQP